MGTCLGAQAMLVNADNNNNILKYTDNRFEYHNSNILIDNKDNTRIVDFFGPFMDLFQQPIHYFNHKWSVTLTDFYSNDNLANTITPLAYSTDKNGEKILSLAEYKKYPFFITMFHPEKSFPLKTKIQDDMRKKVQVMMSDLLYYTVTKESYLISEFRGVSPFAVLEFDKELGTRNFYINN